MTDERRAYEKAICEVAKVSDIGDVSDGFHTFNSLYEQRMILFAALVKAYRDKAWKSHRHEDGEYCFGGGWFIVGIDTPEGSYTYHYENKYWDMFDCADLPRAKHWDGHTEADAETRLMSLAPTVPQWIPCSEKPITSGLYIVTLEDEKGLFTDTAEWNPTFGGRWQSVFYDDYAIGEYRDISNVIAWMPLPDPYKEET